MERLDAPDQSVDQGPNWTIGGDQSNICYQAVSAGANRKLQCVCVPLTFVFSSNMGVADTMWIAASEALTLTEVRPHYRSAMDTLPFEINADNN